ncbi:MAG: DUF2971 domain-containing protein [Sulfuricurvum sp.]|nr:DUF2971 domain-containing protein [Sulfuricurvum sp.]
MNELKIWRYMDLTKFISLLSNKALYFASPEVFDDPYEFYLPDSDNEHLSKVKKDVLEGIERDNSKISEMPFIKKMIEQAQDKSIETESSEFRKKYGVSCWHINEYENDALWKIYSNQGQGIAIETTSERLQAALKYKYPITFGKVRYENYDKSKFQQGHIHTFGFIKRKAFEYEKEYRAVVKLIKEEDYNNGCLIDVDLDKLVEKIHISPLMPKYFLDSVKYLCQGELSFLQERISHSNLYDKYEKNGDRLN